MITANDILDIMRKIDVHTDIDKLDHNVSLKEQRVDSLDMISILFALEEHYQIKIPEEDTVEGRLSTINAIVEYINRKKQ